MQDEKKSVLFSTHITSDLDKIGDYITLIDDGKIIFSESKEDLLSQYTIVQIDKSIMNEELYSKLSGARETAFGFEGLTNDKELIEMSGVKISRPTIEDIIVFRGGL
jgi:ABC-2 type transport system ATP-binding protein